MPFIYTAGSHVNTFILICNVCTIREKKKLIFLQNILYDYLNYVKGSKEFQHGVDADHEAEYFRGRIYLSVSMSIIPHRKAEGGL